MPADARSSCSLRSLCYSSTSGTMKKEVCGIINSPLPCLTLLPGKNLWSEWCGRYEMTTKVSFCEFQ